MHSAMDNLLQQLRSEHYQNSRPSAPGILFLIWQRFNRNYFRFFYFRDIITLTFKYNALLIYWKYVCTLKKTNVYFFLVCSGTTHEIVLQKFKFWDIHKNPKFKKTWGQHPVGHSVSPGAHGPRVRWLVSCWISCTRCTSDISEISFHFLTDFGESSSRENTLEKKTKTTRIGVFIMLFNIYW